VGQKIDRGGQDVDPEHLDLLDALGELRDLLYLAAVDGVGQELGLDCCRSFSRNMAPIPLGAVSMAASFPSPKYCSRHSSNRARETS
jgi:hypothetical protein